MTKRARIKGLVLGLGYVLITLATIGARTTGLVLVLGARGY